MQVLQQHLDPGEPSSWILLPPSGKIAICKVPTDQIPNKARLATGAELLAANMGKPFPWGHLPTPKEATSLWKKHRVGIGGLIHNKWFVTSDGRLGGAPNVPEELPGSLRCSMLLDGGTAAQPALLAENEGFAVVRETTKEDQLLYRRVQLYAAEHVMADGGAIIMSPYDDAKSVNVGFVGRCQYCPNAEMISFKQLCKEISDVEFKLWPEWNNWQP